MCGRRVKNEDVTALFQGLHTSNGVLLCWAALGLDPPLSEGESRPAQDKLLRAAWCLPKPPVQIGSTGHSGLDSHSDHYSGFFSVHVAIFDNMQYSVCEDE